MNTIIIIYASIALDFFQFLKGVINPPKSSLDINSLISQSSGALMNVVVWVYFPRKHKLSHFHWEIQFSKVTIQKSDAIFDTVKNLFSQFNKWQTNQSTVVFLLYVNLNCFQGQIFKFFVYSANVDVLFFISIEFFCWQ